MKEHKTESLLCSLYLEPCSPLTLSVHPIIPNYFKVCRQRESYVSIARPTLNWHKFYISSDGRIILIYSKHDTNNYGKNCHQFPNSQLF